MCGVKKIKHVIYRLRPDDAYRIGEHESWFMDMAERGFHLDKMGVRFARFRRGKPEDMEYRVDLFPGIEDPLGKSQKDFYQEYGWEYVTKYGRFCVYRSPRSAHAPELHTDLQEQSYMIAELEKTLRHTAGFVTFMVLLIVILFCWIWFLSPTPILHLIEGQTVQQGFLLLVEAYLAVNSMQSWLAIRRLRDALKGGHAIDHHAPWRKRKRRSLWSATFFTLIALMTCVIPTMQLTQMKEGTLPLAGNAIPVVRLAEVEQHERLERLTEKNLAEGEIDFENNYESEWTLFAKSRYESSEHGVIYSENWKDGSGVYSPSVTCELVDLRFQALAKPLAKEMIMYYGRPKELAIEGERFEKRKDEGFEFLYVHESDASLEVCAIIGKKVIFVRYYGYAEPQNVINAIAKTLKNI